jgi:hypothetical protein
MFKRFLGLGAFFALVFSPVAARAADNDGPTFILRAQSIDKTLDLAEYALAQAGKDGDEATQWLSNGLNFARLLIGPKGIEGIDTKKPFVMYANLAEEVQKSEVVVMVPIADQETFLDLLKKRLNLKPEEKDGLYSVEVPKSPAPIFFRFANKYVYGTYQNKSNIDEKNLPKPSEIVGEDKSALSVTVRIDRFPEQLKKFAMGVIEQQLAEAKRFPIPNETDTIKTLKEVSVDCVADGIKQVLFDTKEITLKLDVDTKTDELALELTVSGVKGSDLAKTIASWKSKSVVSAALLDKPALALTANVGLPQSIKKALAPAIDEGVKLGLSLAPGELQEIFEPLAKAMMPTLKAAEFDGGLALMGPNSKNLYTYIQASKIKDGLKIESAIKDVVKKIPEAGNFVKLDAEKIGDVSVHSITLPQLDENAKKMFGDSDIHLAFRDDLVLVAFGPDYKQTMKAVLSSKPSDGPIAKFTVNGYKLSAILEATDPAAAKVAKAAFGKTPEAESFYVTIEAGNELKIRVAAKTQVIKFGIGMEKAKQAKLKGQ